jgi:hypothetical protein
MERQTTERDTDLPRINTIAYIYVSLLYNNRQWIEGGWGGLRHSILQNDLFHGRNIVRADATDCIEYLMTWPDGDIAGITTSTSVMGSRKSGSGFCISSCGNSPCASVVACGTACSLAAAKGTLF